MDLFHVASFDIFNICHFDKLCSEGNARMTIFASQSNARTFDYQAGDIGYVPASFGRPQFNQHCGHCSQYIFRALCREHW